MSSKSKTKTKVTPYDPAAITAGQGALNTGYAAANNTITQNSPALQGAINQIQSNIAAPPQYTVDARNELDKTIKGDYLDPSTNPYSAGMAKLIGDRAQGSYNATFGASGRSHGGLAALLSGQGVGDAVGNFYGNTYNAERARQQAAMAAAPAFNADEYTAIDQLFPAVQNATSLPLTAANSYAGGLGNLIAPYTTTNTTQKQNFGLQQALGLAGMIAGGFAGGGGIAAPSMGQMPISPGLLNPQAMASAPGFGSLGYLPGFGG